MCMFISNKVNICVEILPVSHTFLCSTCSLYLHIQIIFVNIQITSFNKFFYRISDQNTCPWHWDATRTCLLLWSEFSLKKYRQIFFLLQLYQMRSSPHFLWATILPSFLVQLLLGTISNKINNIDIQILDLCKCASFCKCAKTKSLYCDICGLQKEWGSLALRVK